MRPITSWNPKLAMAITTIPASNPDRDSTSPTISTLSQGDPDRHLRLWGVLRYALQSYLERHPSPEAARRIRGLLAGEPLPLKGNLLTRFLRQPDRQARYLPLNHPLGVIDSIHPADFPKIHL